MTCNPLIIGGGPAGYEAALAAAKLGLKPTLVEKEYLGGTCLNWGCIPTKFFLGAVSAQAELQGQEKVKTASGQVRVDLAALVARKNRHLEATRKAMAAELAGLGVPVVRGEVVMMGLRNAVVKVNGEPESMGFENCLLATGSRPADRPGLKADHETILNSGNILSLTEVPKHLLIIGAGAIGLELAQFFSRLGSAITLVEVLDRIAPFEDEEVSLALAKIFARQGWAMHTKAKIAKLEAIDGQARLSLEDGTEIAADKALLAIGRHPNSRNLMLEMLGAELKGPGWIGTDAHLKVTSNIYAVGDVNGRTLLAHAAEHQARYAVSHLAGLETGPYEPGPIPGCMYGEPQTVRVGQTAAEAQAQGQDVRVSRANLIANPIAQAHGATAGFMKCVWGEDRLIGVTGVGYGVAGLATLALVLVRQGWTQKQARELIFPHPTLDESLKAALLAEAKPS
jgi:dihydrolipoamide dehydrogenase